MVCSFPQWGKCRIFGSIKTQDAKRYRRTILAGGRDILCVCMYVWPGFMLVAALISHGSIRSRANAWPKSEQDLFAHAERRRRQNHFATNVPAIIKKATEVCIYMHASSQNRVDSARRNAARPVGCKKKAMATFGNVSDTGLFPSLHRFQP